MTFLSPHSQQDFNLLLPGYRGFFRFIDLTDWSHEGLFSLYPTSPTFTSHQDRNMIMNLIKNSWALIPLWVLAPMTLLSPSHYISLPPKSSTARMVANSTPGQMQCQRVKWLVLFSLGCSKTMLMPSQPTLPQDLLIVVWARHCTMRTQGIQSSSLQHTVAGC